MTTYVVVAVRRPGGASVYGPCHTHQQARQAITLLGVADETIWATRIAVLTSPRTMAVHGGAATTALEMPREVLHIINAYPPSPTTSRGPAVVLAVTGPPDRAVVIGPFPTGTDAARWVDQATRTAGTRALTRYLVLPLDPLTSHALASGASRLAAVVSMTTPTESMMFGPFPDSVHATDWFHHLTSSGRLPKSLERAVVFRITPPFDVTESTAQRAAPYEETEHTRPLFVTVINDRTQRMAGAVGFFNTHDAAQAWWATQEPHFPGVTAEVFTVFEPEPASSENTITVSRKRS